MDSAPQMQRGDRHGQKGEEEKILERRCQKGQARDEEAQGRVAADTLGDISNGSSGGGLERGQGHRGQAGRMRTMALIAD